MDRMTIGMNAIAIKSKAMSDDQKKALDLPDSLHVTITTSDGVVLVDEDAPRKDFDTGSVGFRVYVRDTSAL